MEGVSPRMQPFVSGTVVEMDPWLTEKGRCWLLLEQPNNMYLQSASGVVVSTCPTFVLQFSPNLASLELSFWVVTGIKL